MKLDIQKMIDCGVHFGHQTKHWNPKMKKYIFGTHAKIHIINLEITIEKFKKVLKKIKSIITNKGKILFISTKKSAKKIIKKYALKCNMPYVNHRWLGGTLTNYSTIRKSIKKLNKINKFIKDNVNKIKKKEFILLKKKEKN